MKQSAISATVLAAVMGASVEGGDYRRNPFTLVYEGAITKNEPGKVNIYPVTYILNGLAIAANVYTPAGYDPKKTYPAVIVAHPNGGGEGQVAGLYAQRLAEKGYVTIAADAAYQGASGGKPRNVDKPANRIEDIHGMADFLTRYPGVDSARVGLLGICGGGGYSLAAAQTDRCFQSVATVSMFNSGRVRRNGYADSQLDTIQERLQKASAARAQEVADADEMTAGNIVSPTSSARRSPHPSSRAESLGRAFPESSLRAGFVAAPWIVRRSANCQFGRQDASRLSLGEFPQPVLDLAGRYQQPRMQAGGQRPTAR